MYVVQFGTRSGQLVTGQFPDISYAKETKDHRSANDPQLYFATMHSIKLPKEYTWRSTLVDIAVI